MRLLAVLVVALFCGVSAPAHAADCYKCMANRYGFYCASAGVGGYWCYVDSPWDCAVGGACGEPIDPDVPAEPAEMTREQRRAALVADWNKCHESPDCVFYAPPEDMKYLTATSRTWGSLAVIYR